jgi:queuosine precursor transporter
MDNLIQNLVIWLQSHASAELLTLATFAICAIVILALLRFYGAIGLYVYNAIALVVANIQVLRLTSFEHFSEPVALGTVLFTTTFFVNDLLSEHYGPKVAAKCVNLGFIVQILMTLFMILTIAHPLVPIQETSPPALMTAHHAHEAMMQLFTPSLRIIIASLIAYWISQWLDVLIFARLRVITQGRFLWLRQNVSMIVGGFIDTVIFSVLAWRWMSHTPVPWFELFMTYIISAQLIRLVLNLGSTPLMYLSYFCLGSKPKSQNEFPTAPRGVQS